ncbi:MAG: DUF6765 family protein [Acidobacteriota bacterium]
MQIDFHHAVTYILARWAGFDQQEAFIIAYSAQYVDDSTYVGSVRFRDGETYMRTASAHEIIDARNASAIQDTNTWVPFHFLPGNCGRRHDDPTPPPPFLERLECIQNSLIAQDMLAECASLKQEPHHLHRLGITMHVYADTWAHQHFTGLDIKQNDASSLEVTSPKGYKDFLDELATICPTKLGHAQVSCCPDYPFIEWEYRNHRGKKITRNNTELFLDAASHMLAFMREYQQGGALPSDQGLDATQRDYLKSAFLSFKSKDAETRHQSWLERIRSGDVPGLNRSGENLSYEKRGTRSWKYLALGDDDEGRIINNAVQYTPAFMTSDWKLFHDALFFHRVFVLRTLLPRYGICAA